MPRMNTRLQVFNGSVFAVGGSNPPGNGTWLMDVEVLKPNPQVVSQHSEWATGPPLNCGRTIEALVSGAFPV